MNPQLQFYDAHNHLHDGRLAAHQEAIERTLQQTGCTASVVNGTREADWPQVAELARSRAWVVPSFGLHPWYTAGRSAHWVETLRSFLERSGPRAGVGEIGLDAWIPGHDLADQRTVFLAQLQLAAEHNRAASVHCLQAWGPLMEVLRTAPLPERGFLLHAYGGSAELVLPLAKLGAYFSFSPAHLAPRKQARREIFRGIPIERLLVETDAPDMSPPPEYTRHPLPPGPDGRPVNHPANLVVAYEELAGLRGLPLEVLAGHVQDNFRRLFG